MATIITESAVFGKSAYEVVKVSTYSEPSPTMSLEIIKMMLVETFSWIYSANAILPEHRLQEDLELDSLAMVNLQVAIEDRFSIRFDPISMDLVEVFETVGSLASFLDLYLEELRQYRKTCYLPPCGSQAKGQNDPRLAW